MINLDDVGRTVSLVLGRRDVKADHRLIEDLGAESMDVLGVMVALEEKYGIAIDETAAAGVSTVRDLYEVVLKSHAPIPPADTGRTA
jgi:acyl carrier protein